MGVTHDDALLVCRAMEPIEMEAVVEGIRRNWWVLVAGAMAAMQAIFGFGNLVEDDGGPLYGGLIALGVTVFGAALIIGGIVIRKENRAKGSALIGVGVLPSTLGIAFFWFPPAALYGILAVFVAVNAFKDASIKRASSPA